MVDGNSSGPFPVIGNLNVVQAKQGHRSLVAKVWSAFQEKARSGALTTIADQAIVSGMSFVLGIAVGRWGGAEELGLYTIGLSLVMLLFTIQESLISTPYTGLYHGLNDRERSIFSGSTVMAFALLSLTGSLIFALRAAGFFMTGSTSQVGLMILVLAISSPLFLLRQLVRRIALARLATNRVFLLDACVMVVQLSGLALLIQHDRVSAVSVHALAGVGAGVPAIMFLVLERDQLSFRLSRLKTDLLQCWHAGKWVLAGQGTHYLNAYCISWVIFASAGKAATGTFAACSQLSDGMNPLVIAVSNILAPLSAYAFYQHGVGGVRKVVQSFLIPVVVFMLLITPVFILFGRELLGIVYNEIDFSAEWGTIVMISLGSLANVSAFPLLMALWAVQRADLSFWPQLAGFVVTLAFAIIMFSLWGVFGAATAFLIGRVTTLIISVWFYAKMHRFARAPSGPSVETAT